MKCDDPDGNPTSTSLAGRPEAGYFREVARIAAQVADALDYAHRQGVVHRDIKPSNILLDAQGNIWVADFGLAKLVEGEDLSHSHDLVGTLRFMAPERFRGVTDRRGDIYALGAPLYELLTLRPAFGEPDHARLIDQITHQPPVPLRQHDRRIPRDLETLVLKALAKDPGDRFATAGELREELRRYLESRPILARPVGPAERLWRWCRRNPLVATLGAGLLLALLSGISLSTYYAYRARIGERDALTYAGQADLRAREAQTYAEQLTREKEATRRQAEQIRRERERAETLLYGAEMILALRDLNEGDPATVARRLAVYRPADPDRPDHRGFEWFYLDRLCQPNELLTIRSRFRSIRCVAFSPDGRLLVTSDVITDYPPLSGTIAVWDLATGLLLRTWRGSSNSIGALAFHPNGETLGSSDVTSPIITLWDVATGRMRATLRGHKDGVTQLAFSPDGSLLASSDRTGVVKLWDIPMQDRLERNLSGHRGRVSRIAFSRDGRRLATGSLDWRRIPVDGPTDGSIRIWDVATGLQRAVLAQPDGGVLDLAFSPDGARLLSSSGDGMAQLWDVEGGRLIQTTHGPASGLTVFLPEGPRIVSPGGEIRVWDALTGQRLVSIPGRSSRFPSEVAIAYNAMAIHPDGRRLITGDWDGIRLWDVSADPEPLVLSGGRRGVQEVAISADSRLLAAGGGDNLVRIFDLEGGWERFALAGHEGGPSGRILGVAFRPDGRLVSAGSDATLRVWDAETGRLEQTFRTILGRDSAAPPVPATPPSVPRVPPPEPVALAPPAPAPPPAPAGVAQISFSLDGRRLAVAAGDGTIRCWDTATGDQLWSREVDAMRFLGMSFLSDSRLLVAVEMDSKIVLRDAVSSAEVRTFPDARPSTSATYMPYYLPMTLSRDGRSLASARHLAETDVYRSVWMVLWDVTTGQLRWSTEYGVTMGFARTAETFSPDGSRIATSSGRETTLREVVTGREILKIKGEASLISFSADGRVLAAVSRDGQIRVWDTREATPERRDRRQARILVRWLSPRCRDLAELLARIQDAPSLSEPVRRFALDLARHRPEPSSLRAPGESGHAAQQP